MKIGSVDLACHASDSNEVSCTLPTDDSTTPASGATINTATLSLYVSSATGSQTAGAYKATDAWTESGLTWNNQPSVNGTAEATASVSSTGWKSWTITSLVAAWVGGSAANNGVCIKQSSGSPPNNVRFHSSDYTGDASLRPKLVVDYTEGQGGPTAVSLNAPTNITQNALTLTWTQNTDGNFASYKLYRSTTQGVTEASTLVTTITNSTTTTHNDTNLQPNTTYYYKVFVSNTGGQSAGSNEVNATTQAAPPPTAVTLNNPANVTTSSMDLSWTQNTDANFASYKLYRSTTAGVTEASTLVTTQTNSTITTHTDTNLQPNTTYYYKVYVVNTANVTAGSNEVNATTLQAGAPPAVTLNAPQRPTGSDGTDLSLSWSQSTIQDFQAYKLYRGTQAGVSEMNGTLVASINLATTISHLDTNLTPMSTYYYRVYVVNTANVSTGSNEVSGSPWPDSPPAAVTLNTPTNVTGTSVDLSWTQSTESDFACYKVYRSTMPVVTTRDTLVFTSAQVSGVTCQDTGLSSDTTYYYRVFVLDQAAQQGIKPENYSQSNEVSVYTPAQTGEAPTVSVVSVAGQSVTGGAVPNPVNARSFTVVAQFARGSPTAPKVKKLELFLDTAQSPTISATLTPVEASGQRTLYYIAASGTGLNPGAHTLKVRAIDNADHATYSSPVSLTTSCPGAEGSILSISGSPIPPNTVSEATTPIPVGGASIATTCSYRSVSGRGLFKLQLYLDHTPGTPFPGEWGMNPTGVLMATYDFAAQQNQNLYSGQVSMTWDASQQTEGAHTLTLRTVEDYGETTPVSAEAQHLNLVIDNTSQDLPPAPVALEVSNLTDTSVTLNWTETAIADFQKYEVHKGTTANFTPDPQTTLVAQASQPANTTFGLSPLVPDKDYWFKILVYDTAGQATASNEVHAKTLTTLALFNAPPAGTSFLIETRKYDAAGQLVARYDGNGNGTFYTYNAAGQQTKVTDALGNETTFSYDAAGRKTNELNALNGQTTFAYDTAGRLTSTTDALANVTQFGYDADGNQTSVTDARGNVTTRAYSSRNRLTTVTDPLGHVTSFTYDAVGNRLNELNALNQQTTFTYDAAGRLITQTDAAGHVTSFEYDPVGNRTKVTDANANQTQSAYNLRNLRITETNALGHVTTFGYDAVGNRTSVTDGKGATWTYTFDWANRESSMTQPDNTVEKRSHDANGNLLAKQKPDGNVIKYDYDKLNRLVKKDYPIGTDTTLAYDALGRRTHMVDSTGTTSFTYDTLGRLLSCTQPCGAVSKTVSYTYDSVGNRGTMTDPNGGVQTYTHDNNNRLISTTSPYADTTSYVYDAIGHVTRQNNGNGTYVFNTFDTASNLTLLENRKSDNSLLSSFAYTVDNVGNRLAITESVLGTDNTTYHNATVSYGYDNLYRLISEHRVPANPSANNPAFWYEYQYDAAGNRLLLTQKDEAGNVIGTTASTYDAANKLLTAGNTTYTWDANGNQTGKTVNNATTTHVWDYADSENLTDKMTQLHDGVTMTFTTDADGFRSSLVSGATSTYFLYDRRSNVPGLDPLIAELDASGAAVATYVHANGLLHLTRHSPLVTHRWYHFEAIGSTRQLTEGGEGVTDEYHYEAFGTTAATSGSTANPHKYVGNYGYYEDGESGLALLGVRYYDPLIGLFRTVDPKRCGTNLFVYVQSNPLRFTDPEGLWIQPVASPTRIGGVCVGGRAHFSRKPRGLGKCNICKPGSFHSVVARLREVCEMAKAYDAGLTPEDMGKQKWAETTCEWTRTLPPRPKPRVAWWRRASQQDPCVQGCLWLHEMTHADLCCQLGPEKYEALKVGRNRQDVEVPAHQAEARCLVQTLLVALTPVVVPGPVPLSWCGRRLCPTISPQDLREFSEVANSCLSGPGLGKDSHVPRPTR